MLKVGWKNPSVGPWRAVPHHPGPGFPSPSGTQVPPQYLGTGFWWLGWMDGCVLGNVAPHAIENGDEISRFAPKTTVKLALKSRRRSWAARADTEGPRCNPGGSCRDLRCPGSGAAPKPSSNSQHFRNEIIIIIIKAFFRSM